MSKLKGYKDCQEKFMDEVMDEFEKKKLKISGKRIVKDRKQAVAIGLNIAERNCKYTKKDFEDIKEKVNIFLYNDERKISENKIPLSSVVQTRVLFNYYNKKENKRKANKIRDDLIIRISDAGKKGIKVSKNIFNEISKMY